MTSATTSQTAGTSLAPIPSPSASSHPISTSPPTSRTTQTSKPHEHGPGSKLPYPSPSVENISGFPRINAGYLTEPSEDDSEFNIAACPYPNSTSNRSRSASPRKSEDPFTAQRGGEGTEGNPFRFEARDRGEEDEDEGEDEGPRPERACEKTDGRLSDQSDTSTSSPTSSRTQHPRGNELATPASRDSHAEKNNERDGKRHSGLVEKGWARITGRSSKGEKD